MAKCSVSLPEDLLKKLSQLGNRTDEIATKALEAGGEVVLRQTKSNLIAAIGKDTKAPSQSTGQLVAALGLSRVLVDRNGNYNIKIGFDEYRKDGSSNAAVANILEYGKHNQPARPFLKPAKNKSKAEALETMKRVIEEEVNK